MSNKIVVSLLLFCGSIQAQIAVVNGASFRGDQPVSAGAWATVYGTFTGVSTATASSIPLPKTLGGVSVTVDGVQAPLYYVGPSQINLLIPYATTSGIRPVKVTTSSATINGSVRVIAGAPGLFMKDTQVVPKGAILNQDGITENTSSAPAKRGDVISIYATGTGTLTRTPADGDAPGATPLAETKNLPQVYIGGVEAKVGFSGLNPGFPGLWQLNVTVPNQSFITGKVPVRVFMDGVDSNEVALFVQ